MKNNLFILGAFLCTALFVTSCTDDNKDDDENEGKASIIVGINMQPQADMGYIVPIQDMKAGTMSFANAVETKITPYLMSYRDWVFYVPGTSEGTIVKYSRQDDGTLKVKDVWKWRRLLPCVLLLLSFRPRKLMHRLRTITRSLYLTRRPW